MPKRTDIKTILLIGSGPIIIGQACEFDYSGTQAVKTLKELGYRVVLINSNPATIMTDPEFADRTYIEPIKEDIIAEIIKKENIYEIVVGESVDFSGKLNALSARIEVFILELKEKFNLPVHKQKEFLTSVEARKQGGQKKDFNQAQSHSKVKQIKSGRIDASAAALILQRYLDRRSRQKGGIN